MRSLIVSKPTLAPTVAAHSCALVGVYCATSHCQRSRAVAHPARSAGTSPRWQTVLPRRADSAGIPASAPATRPGAPAGLQTATVMAITGELVGIGAATVG